MLSNVLRIEKVFLHVKKKGPQYIVYKVNLEIAVLRRDECSSSPRSFSAEVFIILFLSAYSGNSILKIFFFTISLI